MIRKPFLQMAKCMDAAWMHLPAYRRRLLTLHCAKVQGSVMRSVRRSRKREREYEYVRVNGGEGRMGMQSGWGWGEHEYCADMKGNFRNQQLLMDCNGGLRHLIMHREEKDKH